jgi:hypothetical protein
LFCQDWIDDFERQPLFMAELRKREVIAAGRLAAHDDLLWQLRFRKPPSDGFGAVFNREILRLCSQVGERGIKLRLAHVKSEILHGSKESVSL